MNKKRIKILLTITLLLIGGTLIFAASKYYHHKWTNDIVEVWEHNGFVTNDMIEIDDGYIAVGFVLEGYMHDPQIRILDKEGKLVKEVEIAKYDFTGQLKKIFKTDAGYVVFGLIESTLKIVTLNSNFEVENKYSNYFVSLSETDEPLFLEGESYYYIVGKESYSDTIVLWRVDKDLSEFKVEEVKTIETAEEKEIVALFERIFEYKTTENITYDSSFIKSYGEGTVYLLYNSSEEKSRVVFYKDGEIVWDKLFDGYAKDGAELNKNFVIGLQTSEGANLVLLDEKGNELETEKLSNYLSSTENSFAIEHLITVGTSGFAVTGTEYLATTTESASMGGIMESSGLELDENGNMKRPEDFDVLPGDGETPPPKPTGKQEDNNATMGALDFDDESTDDSESNMIAKILYFNIIHNVYTKTDGNGTVEANKTEAEWGEGIEFVITPSEGYILKEVKVTDAEGNVVIFTDYTFTMPNADVTIEASFEKEEENPPTTAINILLAILLSITSIIVMFKFKKKSEWINN